MSSTCVIFSLCKFIPWIGLHPLAGRFWPTGCMFDTPVIKSTNGFVSFIWLGHVWGHHPSLPFSSYPFFPSPWCGPWPCWPAATTDYQLSPQNTCNPQAVLHSTLCSLAFSLKSAGTSEAKGHFYQTKAVDKNSRSSKNTSSCPF